MKLATTHSLSSCQRSAEGGRVAAEKAMSSPNSLRPTRRPLYLFSLDRAHRFFPGAAPAPSLHCNSTTTRRHRRRSTCTAITLRRFIVLRLHLYSRNGEEYSEQELRTELIHRSLLSIQKDERECDGCVDFRGNFGFGGERTSTAGICSAAKSGQNCITLSPQDCVSP